MVAQNPMEVKGQIHRFETTNEKNSGRAGLTLISRYLNSTKIVDILSKTFSFLKKSTKGTAIESIFKQLILFFFDGTDFHLTQFDRLKFDPGYSAIIETKQNQMLSSHAIKRFFSSISKVRVFLFRKIIKALFIWRLNIEKPRIIKIGIDTMVLDNNDAEHREGVEPTYKKVKGFQPLQAYWNRYLVDAIFRNGKAHSNHGNHVQRMVTGLVSLIRKYYNKDVPIVLLADAGFFDEALFLCCKKLDIAFVIGGKIYSDIAEFVRELPDEQFNEYHNGRNSWFYCDFGHKRKSWKQFWRTIYTTPRTDESGQTILEFARPETIIHTNLGMNNEATKAILKLHSIGSSVETEISPEAIIKAYHQRARDELINRAFKDFGTEHLPFKSFSSNAAFYYMMAISFFLFESFKHDMKSEVVPVTMYAYTFRRKCIDIAGRIVRHSRELVLKISIAVSELIDFGTLWERSDAASEVLIL